MSRTPVSILLLLAACGGEQKLGTFDTKPKVTISNPPAGSSFDEGQPVDFVAVVEDDSTAEEDIGIQWLSSINGELAGASPADSTGQVLYSTASLAGGNHVITLRATDDGAQTEDATVTITIIDVPDAPEVNFVHPTGNESGREGEAFTFVAQVSDLQDPPETLTVTFESNIDDVFCTPVADAAGIAECDAMLQVGDHTITFSAQDRDGLSSSALWTFPVTSGNSRDDDGDGYSEDTGDCDDGDASVHPNAEEYYNGRDDDCDGLIDDGTVGFDDDGDGQPEIDGDCNDADSSTYRGAVETCDGEDNDCDGEIDEDTVCSDDDGDGWTEVDGDCDDTTSATNPDASEIEDGADNDCDGRTDENTDASDDDLDGYSENDGDCNDASASVYPNASETCDGYDNDCDGTADEANASGCTTYYYDYDGDAYGSSAGSCLCAPSGYYTSSYNNDCYDYNSAANPAATAYSSTSRGDSSYDYNCDGTTSYYYPTSGDCDWDVFTCSWNQGWSSGVAACGARASYITDCDWDVFSCSDSTSTYTQSCR